MSNYKSFYPKAFTISLFIAILFMHSNVVKSDNLSGNNEFQTENIRNGLVAEYKFDSGSFLDTSGNNNHGQGQLTPRRAIGINGDAIAFDGVNDQDHIIIPHSSSLSIYENFTISLWVNIQSHTSMDFFRETTEFGVQTFFGKTGDRNGLSIRAIRDTDSGLWVPLIANGQCPPFDGCPPESGIVLLTPSDSSRGMNLFEWHMLTVTYDSTQLRVFQNGDLVAEMAASEFNLNPDMENQAVYLGAELAGSGTSELWYPSAAILDEVSVFNRALPQNEVRQLFQTTFSATERVYLPILQND